MRAAADEARSVEVVGDEVKVRGKRLRVGLISRVRRDDAWLGRHSNTLIMAIRSWMNFKLVLMLQYICL